MKLSVASPITVLFGPPVVRSVVAVAAIPAPAPVGVPRPAVVPVARRHRPKWASSRPGTPKRCKTTDQTNP
jgi:hypothetical protein